MADLLFKSSWTSIVFEGRNKHYGAFELRQSYDRHMLSALFCTLLSVGLITGIVFTLKWVAGTSTIPSLDENSPTIVEWRSDPEVYTMPKAKETLPKAKSSSSNSTPTSVAADQTTTAAKTTQAIATPIEVSNEGSTITTATEPSGTNTSDMNLGITGTEAGSTGTETTWDASAFAEVMPHFNGNLKAYIANEFNYPSMAVSHGIEGKVLVEVILDEEGKIRKAKILRSLGYGCDEEALRVVYAMPKWEPARVGNRPVKIRMVIPITLKLQ